MQSQFLLVALLCAVLSPCIADDVKKTDKDLDDLANCLIGSFSSQAQSQAKASYWDIRLHMVRIWPEEQDGYWLYVEQARADLQDQPYRQRVYHVHRNQDGQLESVVYEFQGDPLRYAGAYKDLDKLKDVKLTDLVQKKGSELILARLEDGSFKGSTRGKNCVSTLNGAAYATSEAHITPDGLDTWDRGFDKDDKQVWGAKDGPYEFRRLPETSDKK